MKQDGLERILASEIVPSAGFVSGVMEAVRNQASEPPPIPFPWLRALPGLVAAVVVIGIALVKETGQRVSVSAHPSMLSGITRTLNWANQYGFNWIALAILVTLASVGLSMRLATGSWRPL